MPPDEFELNLIVANAGIDEERRSYFEALASIISEFLKAMFRR